ncbi:hypothetical protein [Algoriphagus boritolerans]|uniref:hypothetical protein n=1 Tax=Algoriphagus boritolerans TaxID=308111 RepID=UPI002FCDF7B6
MRFSFVFFAWFGIIPFMPDVVRDLALTPEQKWNSVVLAVAGTVFFPAFDWEIMR